MRLQNKPGSSDQEASYIALLEQNIDQLEQEVASLRMEDEHEAIERDHELANFINYQGGQNLFIKEMLRVLNRYISYFCDDGCFIQPTTAELRSITDEARKVVNR